MEYIDNASYIRSCWTDRIGEMRVAQNSTFVSTCFRSGTALFESSRRIRYSFAITQSWKWTYRENGQDVSSFCDGRFSCFAACRFSIPWQLYRGKNRHIKIRINSILRYVLCIFVISRCLANLLLSVAATLYIAGAERGAGVQHRNKHTL